MRYRNLHILLAGAALCIFFLPLAQQPAYADWALGPPPPQNILYITSEAGDFTALKIPNAMQCLGHTVTVIKVPGANGFSDELAGLGMSITDFDQVWDNRFTGDDAITLSDAVEFNNFLANGGGLFLVGENSGFPARNDPLMWYLNTYINTGGLTNSGVIVDSGDDPRLNWNPVDLAYAQNFGMDSRNIGGPAWTMASHALGGFPLGQHGSGTPVVLNGPLTDQAAGPWTVAHALAWVGCGDIQSPRDAGKLFVFMDSLATSWYNVDPQTCDPLLQTSWEEADFLENVIDFLAPDPSNNGLTKTVNPAEGFPQDTFE